MSPLTVRNEMGKRLQQLCRPPRRWAGSVRFEVTCLSRGYLLACAIAWSALQPSPSLAAGEKPPRWLALRYSEALHSFRQARFPEAFGRFVAIAELGYAPAARHALWMCENGPELFGRPFDCAPQDIEAWARQAGCSPGDALRRIYPGVVRDDAPARARP